MGSIKAVVSEPIDGHEEYHVMVGAQSFAFLSVIRIAGKVMNEYL